MALVAEADPAAAALSEVREAQLAHCGLLLRVVHACEVAWGGKARGTFMAYAQ